MRMNYTRVQRASGKAAILDARLSLGSQPQLIGARSFHDEHRDGVRFPLRPTRDNTNKWAIRPHDVPRHDAFGQDWRFFKLADLVERHLLSMPQISGDIGDALFLVSFYKNRAIVGFRQLPRNLVLTLAPVGYLVPFIDRGSHGVA